MLMMSMLAMLLANVYENGLWHPQGWLGNKEVVLHAGEGPIQTARWMGTLAAWANSVGVKVPASQHAFQPSLA